MDWKTALHTCLREKYADVNGRAQRSEFWWFVLFIFLGSLVASALDAMLFAPVAGTTGPLNLIFTLITIVPAVTVTARRLHDTDRSGWWQLLLLIPIVGFLVILWWTATKGTDGPNRFGPDPLGGSGTPAPEEPLNRVPPAG
ncbi:DUF805 domain-containing protein [Maritimibacter sp. DP1N21-5]|uniref:DUF805 domain-containing protein n=1 Tax=Maritimibacter sp. DP1N21-5 TaxID=2836867 RepID=UPI001C450E4A|nr:DUF805 domain-containing protein [Maritimibacter sp. DP1N21-5]MBV7407619.1 DUF805 domain-containing protein [Maritimibacter sp. DP1N21-5]